MLFCSENIIFSLLSFGDSPFGPDKRQPHEQDKQWTHKSTTLKTPARRLTTSSTSAVDNVGIAFQTVADLIFDTDTIDPSCRLIAPLLLLRSIEPNPISSPSPTADNGPFRKEKEAQESRGDGGGSSEAQQRIWVKQCLEKHVFPHLSAFLSEAPGN